MPIEIKELHIKINVEERSDPSDQNKNEALKKDALIAACVEQVMEILEKQQER